MEPLKEIVVISGKGGTGKTSLMSALAFLAREVVLADCDVDAADLHLVVSPSIQEVHDFIGGHEAVIRPADCTGCGQCQSLCRVDAIRPGKDGRLTVDPLACEGCRVCVTFCPARAIDFAKAVNGHWFVSETRLGPMVHAELGPAQENSGKLVSLIRREARRIARQRRRRWILSDGSPGAGCPVIASITGADLVLVVTEPSLSGKSDLRRVLELTDHFRVPAFVCINKADLNPELTAEVETLAREKGLPVPVKVPYDSAVTRAQVEAKTVMELGENRVAASLRELWNRIQKLIDS